MILFSRRTFCGSLLASVSSPLFRIGETLHADDFTRAVDNLLGVWRNFEPRHVYRADFAGATANSLRWFAGFLFGAFIKNRRISLLLPFVHPPNAVEPPSPNDPAFPSARPGHARRRPSRYSRK